MILTVTLNAALDVTYSLDHAKLGGVNRVTAVSSRAGGKGINVARTLAALGEAGIISGFAGGAAGRAIREDAAATGLLDRLTPIAGESRRTLTIAERDRVTLLNEPGPQVSDQEWKRFVEEFGLLARDCRAVVLSGSLPPGVPEDAYAVLARMAKRASVPSLLDADGEALRAGLRGRPEVVKPNADELASLTGRPCRTVSELVAAAGDLRSAGAEAVVVTRGPGGLLAATDEGTWVGAAPQHMSGNATGAGDAVAAALALGLADGRPWPDRLTDALAIGAAAVAGALAGDVDLDVYRRLRACVRLEKL